MRLFRMLYDGMRSEQAAQPERRAKRRRIAWAGKFTGQSGGGRGLAEFHGRASARRRASQDLQIFIDSAGLRH